MFRKKKSRQSVDAPSSSALTAAAQAVLQKQVNDAQLSSAAAATALRSLTSSPIPVGELQTKRMVRRSSTSSYGSPAPGGRLPLSSPVQRQASTGSMTERRFRTPSPSQRDGVPPVPSIPHDIPPIPTKSAMRVSSPIQPSPLAKSTVNEKEGAVANPNKPFANRKAIHINTESVNGTAADQQAAASSPRSTNFSRPLSPPIPPKATSTVVAPRPSTAQGFAARDEYRVKQQIRQAANKPVSKNTQKIAQPAPGSHLSTNKTVQPKTSTEGIGLAALTAATLASRPAAQATQQQTAPLPSTVAASKSHAAATVQTPATPSPSKKPQTVTPASTPKKNNVVPPSAPAVNRSPQESTPPAQKSTPLPTKQTRSPSQEEIKSYQSKATAMLARPLSDASATVKNMAQKEETTPETTIDHRTAALNDLTIHQPKSNNIEHNRSGSESTVELTPSAAEPIKKPSVSPNRGARFSDTPLYENIVHQPPPRSLSPAKPALKNPSPRTGSPADSTRVPPSDVSDNRSLISEDGIAPNTKKKRPSRVSFEENAVTIGQASAATAPGNTVLSPQYSKFPPGAFTTDDEDEDTGMGPRPNLPSFGSVRARKLNEPETVPTVAETTQLNTATSESDSTQNWGASTDRALAGIVVGDLPSKSTLDSSEEPSTSPGLLGENVPSIAVLPATPNLDNNEVNFVPGSDPATVESEHVTGMQQDTTVVENTVSESILSRELDSNPIVILEHHSEEEAEVYSDAAEDLSDLEEVPGEANDDGGFASLDAIVESPVGEVPPPMTWVTVTNEDGQSNEIPSNSTLIGTDEADPSAKEADWEGVRAYWSSLSEQQRAKLEQEAVPKEAEVPPPTTVQVKKTKKATSGPQGKQPVARSTDQGDLPPWPDKQYQKSVQTKATQQETRTPMKASMRNGATTQRAKSGSFSDADADDERPSGGYQNQAKANKRPLSESAVASPASAALAQALMKQQAKPKLTRTFSSDSSGSDSSFKKRRAAKRASDTGGFMRKSMRGSTQSPPPARPMSPPVAAANKTSIRSLSPSDSLARRSMRTSMRNSTESAGPSLRSGQQQRPKESSFLGFGKSSKTKSTPSKGLSKFTSRFADSSDEEEGRPTFRSRFADSDDDMSSPLASPIKLTPVRGIPRTAGQQEGESTDLSDSDDGNRNNNAAITSSPNGIISGPDSGKKSKRRLFGLSKKQQEDPIQSSPTQNTVRQEIHVPKSLRSQSAEPSSNRRSFMRRLSASKPSTPKGEARMDEYPFPPPPIPAEYRDYNSNTGRPQTSDPVTTAALAAIRPSLGAKRDSAMTAPVDGSRPQRAVIVSERTGKKKKFQGLRRVFGLND